MVRDISVESADAAFAAGSDGRPAVGDALKDAAPPGLQPLLSKVVELKDFRRQDVTLSRADRRLIVDQALVLIEQNYVHLPHKAAMHAVNPVQRLRLLRARLDGLDTPTLPPAADFHAEMSEIFHSLRDLHTNYLLPDPYRGRVAFLPFLVEEFFEDGAARYLVTKVAQGADLGGLAPGVLVTHWNGMPVDRAAEVNAARYAGSNAAARHSRGVESLTIRPLRIHRFPDEDWVTVRYHKDGDVRELTIPWLVAPNLPPMVSAEGPPDDTVTALGLDLDLDEAQRARKLLFAPAVAAAELDVGAAPPEPAADEIASAMPSVFRARRVAVGGAEYGHLRIFTFQVDDPGSFVAEFVRLCTLLPQAGLIVDVRGNGGGHIFAAELTLQTLTPVPITPEPTQFTTTPLNRDLCRQHRDGEGGIDLGPWLVSIEQSVETGAPYSSAYSITPTDLANSVGQRYYGPVVLVTDARCYSATDIFCAGFADHRIGPVLGVDANTGAGGANVWTHGLLRQLVTTREGVKSPYRDLPGQVDMRVAIRRTLRVGAAAGTPVEDLGVLPDERHLMTRRDIEHDNIDLIARAVSLLRDQRARGLDADGTVGADGVLALEVTSAGIDRIDVWLDDRPVRSLDVQDGSTRLDLPASGARRLRLAGYAAGRLVASRREELGPLPDGQVGVQHGATLVTSPAAQVPVRLRFLVTAGQADRRTVQRQVRDVMGPGWEVDPLFDLRADLGPDAQTPPELRGYYAATGPLPRGTDDSRRARAFELARVLMARTGYDVQPDLPSGAMYPPAGPLGPDGRDAASFGGDGQPLPGTDDPVWALKNLRVPQAWGQSPERGQGVVVTQPDTGVTAHPELSPGVDTTRDRDLLDNDNDATDPLTRRWWWPDNPGHGTGTASVVMSREAGVVVGSAPQATLVPLRSNRSVVLVFDGDVARAVEYARQIGGHVITMSLGGVGFSPALRAAIDAAIKDGILVLAAAGNQVGFVVAPANYGEVIAVAASNIQDQPWSGSSHGGAVDVTAAGESVHVAQARKAGGGNVYSTGLGSGTSYAVALTAGVAALWLAHHGRDALIARYGRPNLQAVFTDVLRHSSRQPAGWDTGEYGSGIVDAGALLAAPLPAAVPPLAAAAELAPADSLTATQRLALYLPDRSATTADAALDQLLPGSADRDLYAGELAYHLSQDPMIRAAVVGAAKNGSTASLALSPAQQSLGLDRLRRIASPSLAAALG
jgi:hypothetical protein